MSSLSGLFTDLMLAICEILLVIPPAPHMPSSGTIMSSAGRKSKISTSLQENFRSLLSTFDLVAVSVQHFLPNNLDVTFREEMQEVLQAYYCNIDFT